MAGRKSAVKWPLAHDKVDLNQDTSLLKLIAIFLMVIDHAGKMLFRSNAMRIVGRSAFPVFAYCLAAGCVYTKNHTKFLSRLVQVGLISQPFYALAMGHTVPSMFAISFRQQPVAAALNFYVQSWAYPNIFLTLTLGFMVIWSLRFCQPAMTLGMMLFVWKADRFIDYGWQGVALIVLFYLFINRRWLSFPVVAAFMIWWGLTDGSFYQLFGVRFGMEMFAVAALPLIYIHTHSGIRISKWVFYLFYPGHLIALLLIELALKSI